MTDTDAIKEVVREEIHSAAEAFVRYITFNTGITFTDMLDNSNVGINEAVDMFRESLFIIVESERNVHA